MIIFGYFFALLASCVQASSNHELTFNYVDVNFDCDADEN